MVGLGLNGQNLGFEGGACVYVVCAHCVYVVSLCAVCVVCVVCERERSVCVCVCG